LRYSRSFTKDPAGDNLSDPTTGPVPGDLDRLSEESVLPEEWGRFDLPGKSMAMPVRKRKLLPNLLSAAVR
jgi:hypothetical protein